MHISDTSTLCYTIAMIRIAIIEDDPTISQMYRMKFETEGFEVRMASNGLIGIDAVREFNPDLILLDIQMPELDGVGALKGIRAIKEHQQTPVVILTNLGEEEAPAEIKTLGIDSYIVKASYTPRQVVAHVKKILQLD